jgi:hypothetical protein
LALYRKVMKTMRHLTVLALFAAMVIGLQLSHAENEGRVILERLRILGDSAHPGDAHDVYAISRKTFDEQITLDLRKDTIPLPMEKAVQSCFAQFKRFYAQRNIKDQFVVWRVELKHMPGTKHGAYQGKFYYFIEMQLFAESGRPFFSRRSVLLDGTVVSPVREYEQREKSQPDAQADGEDAAA